MVAYKMLNAHTKHTHTHTNYTQRGLSALYQCQPAMILENNETIALIFFCSVNYSPYFLCDAKIKAKIFLLRAALIVDVMP